MGRVPSGVLQEQQVHKRSEAHNPEEHVECVWLCVGPVEPVEADRRLGEAYVGGRVKGECPPVCVVSCVESPS